MNSCSCRRLLHISTICRPKCILKVSLLDMKIAKCVDFELKKKLKQDHQFNHNKILQCYRFFLGWEDEKAKIVRYVPQEIFVNGFSIPLCDLHAMIMRVILKKIRTKYSNNPKIQLTEHE